MFRGLDKYRIERILREILDIIDILKILFMIKVNRIVEMDKRSYDIN